MSSYLETVEHYMGESLLTFEIFQNALKSSLENDINYSLNQYENFKNKVPNALAEFNALINNNIREAVKYHAIFDDPCTRSYTAEGLRFQALNEDLDSLLNKAALYVTLSAKATYDINYPYKAIQFFKRDGEEVINDKSIAINKNFEQTGVIELLTLVKKSTIVLESHELEISEAYDELYNEVCSHAANYTNTTTVNDEL